VNDPLKVLGFLLFAIYLLTSIWLFLNGLIQLHLLWHYKKNKKAKSAVRSLPVDLPFVSIQVPVYNEKYVIGRLLSFLQQLDYPSRKMEIQVLDDSTDETSSIIYKQVVEMRQRGIDVTVLHRKERKGFKAGALEYGMPFCKGELIAIFDADFTPDPQFLKDMVPYFSDPQIGLVQARWGHLNREENYLTRIQTFLLDTHFSVEQKGRSNAGYFINFCGTAGIWRRQCIEQAGGWDGDVLSEDLDLSYRAQLKGWKLVYDADVKVPAELPSVIEAFKIQQFRWTKGMAQISKKHMKHLLAATLPFGKKLHGVFHLLGSFVFVCLFINALLTVPLLIYRSLYPEFIELTQYSLFTTVNLVALTLFYYNGTRSGDNPSSVKFLTHYPLFLVIYMALSVQNAIAVIQGFIGSRSAFIRTPKSHQSSGNNTYLNRRWNWINGIEVAILCYFLFGIFLSIYLGDYFMMLFFLMIGYGLAFIVYQSLLLLKPDRIVKADDTSKLLS
jgi:cellulose synthase/poly-beta-1,6-N-acetylglucosamine synthase-like glycosyltransferase